MKIVTTFHTSVHLDDHQLLPPHQCCLFCGSGHVERVYELQDAPRVWLMKCAECHAASASRLPTSEILNDFYEGYYQSPLVKKCDRKITFDNARRFAGHLARRVEKSGRRSSMRILDFGGGDGTVAVLTAREIVRQGAGVRKVDIIVVDYNQDLVSVHDEGMSLQHYESIENLPTASFDFVIASAVIEHIPGAKDTLLKLLALVKNGGLFYARTPNVAPLVKAFGSLGFKFDYNFPAHLHDLGQDFWEAFFASDVCSQRFVLLESRPSLVQTAFRHYFVRTLAAYLLKAPWYVLGRHYRLVGGWEVFAGKKTTEDGL